jgi:hypothetical protein
MAHAFCLCAGVAEKKGIARAKCALPPPMTCDPRFMFFLPKNMFFVDKN